MSIEAAVIVMIFSLLATITIELIFSSNKQIQLLKQKLQSVEQIYIQEYRIRAWVRQIRPAKLSSEFSLDSQNNRLLLSWEWNGKSMTSEPLKLPKGYTADLLKKENTCVGIAITIPDFSEQNISIKEVFSVIPLP